MIKLNNEEVKITRFPDNSIKFDIQKSPSLFKNEITWNFESMEELFTIVGLAGKLKSTVLDLNIPYLPNARMDKIQSANEGLMLKYTVETLDNLGFNKIKILDPHSDIYKQWVKNTEWVQDDELVKELIERSVEIIKEQENVKDVTFVYPDKGARNRYLSLLGAFDNLYGVKEGDQSTGKILNFDLIGDVPSNPVIIVDDICSKGGTFYFTAKKLREKGFTGNIYLYVTHAEEAIEQGELLNNDSEITKIFTTDSLKRVFSPNTLLNKNFNKITTFNL